MTGVHIAPTCIDLVDKLEGCKTRLTTQLVQPVVQHDLHLHNLLIVTHCTLMHGYWWWLIVAHLIILLHACLCTEILHTVADSFMKYSDYCWCSQTQVHM